jgi:DNA-binding NtrC family response regulator/tetratricopeptide (TPR) repeat protein
VERLDGEAPAIAALRERIGHLAAFDTVGGAMVPTLLLQGETGTGKGLVARLVHDSGPRARGPFVPVNCAAIPETMLEAELFGYEPGAFTDAKRAKPGLFEAAAGGSLFLDEVDSLSLGLQSKLLTAIEDKRVRRLGAVTDQAVDVKLVAATQHDLAQLAAAGRFRPDLFHRLAVVVLVLPPLRERGDDVVLLARLLLDRFARGYGVAPKTLAPDAEEWVRRHPWPGNVRELGHAMERVTLLHDGSRLDARALAQLAGAPSPRRAGETPPASSAPVAASGGPAAPSESEEARELRAALVRSGGNVLGAARLLGVTRDTVRYRMRRHGIARPDVDPASAAPALGGRAPLPAVEAPAAPPPPAAPSAGDLAWEHKPVALVAIEMTWPSPPPAGPPGHEPWTEAARWNRAIREKLEGLGGILVQQSLALTVWAFGIPRAVDQLHQRAVHGALAVRNLAASQTERAGAPELRLAVHLGAMVVESAGPHTVGRALPVGDTLALPVRLLAEAGPGEVLTSARVARQVETWVSLEPIEVEAGAARTGALAAYRVIGVSSWRERGRRPPDLTPFVGRAREMELLHELLAAASAGRGQAVGLVGEAGSGKSRVLRELRATLRGTPVRYAEAHCLAHGSLTPFLPLIERARQFFDLAESESVEESARKLHAGLAALGVDADAHAPDILRVLHPEAAGRPADDPEAAKRRTFEAFRQFLVGFGGADPFVFAIENVHWSDPTFEESVGYLVDRLAGTRCLLVVTYRPGYRPGWLDRSYASQIALPPLSAEDSGRLVRAAVGDLSLTPEAERRILARGDGNPLFLEELARSVREQGDAETLVIPDTVHAVLAARIDRLAPDDKRLLQTAAVIGREFPLGLLERVSGLPAAGLEERLLHLVRGEFLFERDARGERTFTFRQVLVQTAAYQSLPPAARQDLHRRTLEALTAPGAERRPDLLASQADHAARAGIWDKAVEYFRRASADALSRHALREGVRCLEQALAALAHRADDPGTLAAAGDLRFDLAQAQYSAGQLDRARRELGEARAIAEKLDDAPRLARVLMGLLHVHSTEGRYEEATAAGERTLAIAEAIGSTPARVWASIGLCRVLFAAGDYRRGAAAARDALEALAGEPETGPVGMHWVLQPAAAVRTYLALCLARTGDFDEAIREAEDAVAIAERAGAPVDRAWAAYGLARAHHARTAFERAIPLLEGALALLEDDGGPAFLTRILAGLASAYAQSGRSAEAPPLLDRALALGRSASLEQGRALILVQLGETRLATGALDEAARLATEALDLARARGERGNEAWALHLCGEVDAARGGGRVDAARRHLAEALALADTLAMRPLVARCRLSAGALELAAGASAEARSALSTAIAELAAMGITAWRARAEALLAECPSPP